MSRCEHQSTFLLATNLGDASRVVSRVARWLGACACFCREAEIPHADIMASLRDLATTSEVWHPQDRDAPSWLSIESAPRDVPLRCIEGVAQIEHALSAFPNIPAETTVMKRWLAELARELLFPFESSFGLGRFRLDPSDDEVWRIGGSVYVEAAKM